MESWADIVVGGKAAKEPQAPIVKNVGEEEEKYNLWENIITIRKSLEAVRAAMKDLDLDNEEHIAEMEVLQEEHDSLSEALNFANWQFGHMVGYEYLAQMRKIWGIETDKQNKLQEKYYKLQKACYEHCKRVKGFFTQDDRDYIAHYKELNEEHMQMRWAASECREIFSDIIEAAFPDAPFDLGWDEVVKA